MQRSRFGLVGGLVLVLMIVGGLAAPVPVLACVSDHPTFAEAVDGARAIARVTILEGFDTVVGKASNSETYRVDRVLKGRLPKVVTLAPADTSLCGDSVGYFAGAEGTTVVVAFEVRFYDSIIHPMWMRQSPSGIFGSAGTPEGVTSISALEDRILDRLGLPATSTIEPAERSSTVPVLVAVAADGFVLALVRFRSTPRRRTRPSRWP